MKEKLKKSIRVIVSLAIVCSFMGVSKQYTTAQETTPTDNGLELNKTAKKNTDGTYTITLESYTTGKATTIQKEKPTDIVLVLDQSGSMSEYMDFKNDYYAVYANGNPMYNTDVDYRVTYYILVNGEYVEVKNNGKFISPPALAPIAIFESKDGKKYLPLKDDSSEVIQEEGVTSVQFYRRVQTGKGDTKLQSLQKAANTFIDNVIANGGDHRIAVVGFADGYKKNVAGEQDQNYENTELFIGSQGYRYDKLNTNTYQNAFQSTLSNVQSIRNSIASLTAVGNTRADLGMDMANKILTNDTLAEETGRNKVVVMFTDGEPNSGGKASTDVSDGFLDRTVANDTIAVSKLIKDAKAKVYTVGVIDTLDPTKNPADTSTNNLNRYMQYVSSNFPTATSLQDAGTNGNYQNGDFLSATNSDELKEIFDKISQDISSPTLELDDKTVLKDIMSEYFNTPSTLDIKAYTSACSGKIDDTFTWAPREEVDSSNINIEVDKTDINVTGFNYKENFVAINDVTNAPRGSKLIIEFTTTKKPDFIGGVDVPTNNENSGIYVEDELFEKFPQPTVDVDIDFGISDTKAMGIYVGSTNNGYETLFDDINQTGMQYILGNTVYTIDGKNNKYVNIVYTLTKDGDVVGEYTIPAGGTTGTWSNMNTNIEDLISNTNIKINAKVTASKNVDVSKELNKDTTIYVFTPEIEVKNDVIFLGETTKLDSLITDVNWVNTDDQAITPNGLEPTLTYQFIDQTTTVNKDNYAPTTDKELHVEVWNGSKNITAQAKVNTIAIQVVSGELDITKTMDDVYTADQTINANQTFIFRIDVRDTVDGAIRETFYQSIDFSANNGQKSQTLKLTNLSKGYYTVTEDSSWSWKYSEDNTARNDNYQGNANENELIFIGDRQNTNGKKFYGSASGTIIAGNDESNQATVKIHNTIKNTNILGDGAIAKNKFTNDK